MKDTTKSINVRLMYEDTLDTIYGVSLNGLKDLIERREELVSAYEVKDNKIVQFIWDKFNGYHKELHF